MSLFEKHKSILDNAIKAIHERKFYAQYPEHPKAYGEEAPKKALDWFNGILNNQFNDLLQEKPTYLLSHLRIPNTTHQDYLLYRSDPAMPNH